MVTCKHFIATLRLWLPAALLLTGLYACQNTGVDNNTAVSVPQGPKDTIRFGEQHPADTAGPVGNANTPSVQDVQVFGRDPASEPFTTTVQSLRYVADTLSGTPGRSLLVDFQSRAVNADNKTGIQTIALKTRLRVNTGFRINLDKNPVFTDYGPGLVLTYNVPGRAKYTLVSGETYSQQKPPCIAELRVTDKDPVRHTLTLEIRPKFHAPSGDEVECDKMIFIVRYPA